MTKFTNKLQFLPPSQIVGPMTRELQPRDFWRDGIDMGALGAKLLKLKRHIMASALLGFLLFGVFGAVYAQMRSVIYSAATEVLITNTTLQMSGPDAVVTQVMLDSSLLESQMELMKSGRVLEKVLDQNGVEAVENLLPRPSQLNGVLLVQFLQPILALLSAPVRDTSPKDNLISHSQSVLTALRAAVSVKRLGSTQIAALKASGATSEGAAFLANSITRAYLSEQDQSNSLITTSAAFRERIKVLGATARVINEAIPPRLKDGPGGTLVTAIAAALGGLSGLMIAVLLACFDTKIRSSRQLCLLAPAEFLGPIPRLTTSTADGPEPAILRIGLAGKERLTRTPRVIGITSCSAGVGKSFVAERFASLMAKEGQKVLLVDGNGMNPELSHYLATGSQAGLHQILGGAMPFAQCVLREIECNLDFLPLGNDESRLVTGWTEYFGIVEGNIEPYAWIVVELPPMGAGTYVRAAGAVLDGLVVVVADGQTREPALEAMLQLLGPVRDKLLGVILNDPVPATRRHVSSPIKASKMSAQEPEIQHMPAYPFTEATP